jgi:hypothetical protein
LDCVTYGTEEATDTYFQFVLRENHNAKCGGDPETSPVIDRYRIIGGLARLSGWNGSKTTGDRTIRPKSDSPNPSRGTRLAIVIVLKQNRL